MKRFGFLLALVAVVGCGAANKKVVGSWEPDTSAPKNIKNMGDMAKSLITPSLLEFNENGKYKETLFIASREGTYSVSGDELTLTPEKGGQEVYKILSDTRMQLKKNFESDPDVFMVRKSSK